jgi:hypothetical protein
VSDVTAQDLGRVTRLATDKAKREIALPKKRPATVIEFHDTADANVPRAMVHFDNAPADVTHMVAVNGTVESGERVHVQFEPPHGMSVVGRSGSSGAITLPCNVSCGSEPSASVTFHLDAPARVGIIISAETLSSWSIDGVEVDTPHSPFLINTSYTFDTGDHTVAASGTGKDPQCLQILLITGGTNTDDDACVTLHEDPTCLDVEAQSGGFSDITGDLSAGPIAVVFSIQPGTYDVTLVVDWVQDSGGTPTGAITASYDIEPDSLTGSNAGSSSTVTVGPAAQTFTTGGSYTATLNISGLTGAGTSGFYNYHLMIGEC